MPGILEELEAELRGRQSGFNPEPIGFSVQSPYQLEQEARDRANAIGRNQRRDRFMRRRNPQGILDELEAELEFRNSQPQMTPQQEFDVQGAMLGRGDAVDRDGLPYSPEVIKSMDRDLTPIESAIGLDIPTLWRSMRNPGQNLAADPSEMGSVTAGIMDAGAGFASLGQRLFGGLLGDANQTERDREAMMQAHQMAVADSDQSGPRQWLNRNLPGVTSSLTQVAGLSPLAEFTGGQALGFGTLQANQSYSSALEAGLSPVDALEYAMLMGAVEGGIMQGFEAAGLGGTEKKLAQAGVDSLAGMTGRQVAKEIGKRQAQELAEELLTTTAQQGVGSQYLPGQENALSLRDREGNLSVDSPLGGALVDTASQVGLTAGITETPQVAARAITPTLEAWSKRREEANFNAGVEAAKQFVAEPSRRHFKRLPTELRPDQDLKTQEERQQWASVLAANFPEFTSGAPAVTDAATEAPAAEEAAGQAPVAGGPALDAGAPIATVDVGNNATEVEPQADPEKLLESLVPAAPVAEQPTPVIQPPVVDNQAAPSPADNTQKATDGQEASDAATAQGRQEGREEGLLTPPASGPEFEQFRKEYIDTFRKMMQYEPDQSGSRIYADRLAQMSDSNPGWVSQIENESPAANPAVAAESGVAPQAPAPLKRPADSEPSASLPVEGEARPEASTQVSPPSSPQTESSIAAPIQSRVSPEALVTSASKIAATSGDPLVLLGDLRKEFSEESGVTKPEFDRAVLDAAKAGKIGLHVHDLPGSLTPEEQSRLVINPDNSRAYIGATVRQPQPQDVTATTPEPKQDPELPKLIEKYQPLIRSIFKGRVSTDLVDDLTNDVNVKVLSSGGSRDTSKPFAPWVKSIARNLLTDHFRKQGRSKVESVPEVPEAAVSPELAGSPTDGQGTLQERLENAYLAVRDPWPFAPNIAKSNAKRLAKVIESREYDDIVAPNNKQSRKFFEVETGKKLPPTVGTTKKFFEDWKAEGATPQVDIKKAEPVDASKPRKKKLNEVSDDDIRSTVLQGMQSAGEPEVKIPAPVGSGRLVVRDVRTGEATVIPERREDFPTASVVPPATGILKDDTKAAREELAEKMRAIAKKYGGRANSISPEMLSDFADLTVAAIRAGVLTFRDYVNFAAETIGADVTRRLLPQMRAGWNSVRDQYDTELDEATEDAAREVLSKGEPDVGNRTAESEENQGGSESRRGEVGADSRESAGDGTVGVLEGASPNDDTGVPETRDTQRPGDNKSSVGNGSREVDAGGGNESGGSQPSGEQREADGARGERPADEPGSEPTAITAGRPNYHLKDYESILGGGPRAKFDRNRKAIEAYYSIKEQNRAPTQEELDTIAGYIGWGSFGQELFQGTYDYPRPKDGWKDASDWLRSNLSKEEWESVQASITNAHYTDPETVQAMWDMARTMGFSGGRVLEPATGVGNFLSLMPRDLMEQSQITGIELDVLSGGMAQMLHPNANIQIKGYQDSQTPDNFYDLVISNVPFANVKISDRRYDKFFPSLHNYYFLKAVDQVRPGGLVMFITSNFSMDGVKATRIRREIAGKANLVAAMRFPTGAFSKYAGTKVVADLVILQKRHPGESPNDNSWIETRDFNFGGDQKIKLNEYWLNNPTSILGQIGYGSGTTNRAPGMIVTRTDDFPEKFKALVDKAIPKGIVKAEAPKVELRSNKTGRRQQSVVTDKGDLFVVHGEHLVPLDSVIRWKVKSPSETASRAAQIKDLLQVRDALVSVLDSQANGNEDATSAARKMLNAAYDSFVAKYGPITESKSIDFLRAARDPMASSLQGLESAVPSGGYEKRPIFSRNTARGKSSRENLSIGDAFAVVRNSSMTLDLNEVAKLAKASVQDVEKELTDKNAIYKTAAERWEPRDVFLSGNVRVKLREAIAAKAEGIKGLDRSIDALKAVIPPDVPYANIEANIGATWVESKDYADFLGSLLGEDGSVFKVDRIPRGWKIDSSMARVWHKPEATQTWGTTKVDFKRLFIAAMENTYVKVTEKDDDGNVYTDEVATREANDKIDGIKEQFKEWIWKTPERISRLSRNYNETFSAVADPNYDGSHLSFDGMALTRGDDPFSLRKHQENAAWRGIVTGRGLFAHEVGTGKTITMAAIAIESKKLGLMKKPVVFAHNANAADVARDFKLTYPGAKILYVDNLSPANRSLTLSQIALDDWDAVIVPHSLVDRFSLKPESLELLLKDQIESLEQAALSALEDEGITSFNFDDEAAIKRLRVPTAKEMAKERLRLKEKIKKAAQLADNAETVFFEDMGIDAILVDEAHEFKKLPLATKQKVKGLNTTASQRGTSIMLLADYVRQLNGNGRGVFLFTGTPITNSLNEIYNMQRMVMPDVMKDYGVLEWDGWFNQFASTVSDLELSAGGTWETVERLAAFINVPELRRMVGEYMDTVFADDMPEFTPRENREGMSESPIGRPFKNTVIDSAVMTPSQAEQKRDMSERYQRFKNLSGKEKRDAILRGDPDTPLVIEGEGVKSALDPRLVDISADGSDPNLKFNRVVNRIMQHYQEDGKTTQMVFMQSGFSDSIVRKGQKVAMFGLADALIDELVSKGIPRNEIVIFSELSREQRADAAAKMRDGTVRVAIGSTQTMGTGVNAQTYLRAMHQLDAPWVPSDLEQRNGRGHRQGNKWNTVFEYRYLQEGSHDGRRWQILLTKDRFIRAFMRGSADRVIEGDAVSLEEEGGGDFFSETFSGATGDPRTLIRAKLAKDVEKLERMETRHARSVNDAADSIADANREIGRLEREVADRKADIEQLNSHSGQPFEIEVQGTRYTDRELANAALGKADIESARVAEPMLVGKFKGFEIRMANRTAWIRGKRQYAVGASAASIEGNLRQLPGYLQKDIEKIASLKRLIEQSTELQSKPFARAADLEQKRKQLKSIESELALSPVPPPAWLRDGLPSGSGAFWKGREYEVVAHRMTKDSAFVLLKTDSGLEAVDIGEITDSTGARMFPMFDKRAFGVVTRPGETSPSKRLPGTRWAGRTSDELVDLADEERARRVDPDVGGGRAFGIVPPSMVGPTPRQKPTADDVNAGTSRPATQKEIDDAIRPDSKEVQERLAMADGVPRPDLKVRIAEFAEDVAGLTRQFKHIPNKTTFAKYIEVLRLMGAVRESVSDQVTRYLAAILDPIPASVMQVFTRKIIYENELHAQSLGQLRHYGFTSPEEVQRELDKVNALIEKPSFASVRESLKRREEVRRDVAQKLVDLKMLDQKALENDKYFHQQVLFYSQAMRQVTGQTPAPLKRGFQIKRSEEGEDLGSAFDPNSNYLESEAAWLTDALVEIRKAELLSQLGDDMPKLKSEAKRRNYVAVVGGQDVMDRIEKIRGEMAELREAGGFDNRVALKQLSDELWELDPTMEFRAQMAKALDDMMKDIDQNEYVDAEHDSPMTMAQKLADAPEGTDGRGAAIAFLAAARKREEFMEKKLGKNHLTWQKLLREKPDLAAWYPHPKNVFYRTLGLTEKAQADVMAELLTNLEAGATVRLEDLRQITALATGKDPIILPAQVVKQLESMERPVPRSPVAKAFSWPVTAWKWFMTVGNPLTVGKYMLSNQLGDFDVVLAGAPGANLKVQDATTQLYKYYYKNDLAISNDLRAARDFGVISSSLAADEIKEIHEVPVLRRFARQGGSIWDIPGNVLGKIEKFNETRESILRLATFLHFKEGLKNGTLKYYAASNPEAIKQIMGSLGVDAAAAKMSRDLMGDYGALSTAGNFLRRYAFPFWAFSEINMRRYKNLAVNAYRAGIGQSGLTGSVMTAAMLMRIAAWHAGIMMMNWLLWPEEEQELSVDDRYSPHINLGRADDGHIRIMRNSSAFGELLEWAGLNQLPGLMQHYQDGQMSFERVVEELWHAPINKVAQMLNPYAKTGDELLTGQSRYPDVFNPRSIDTDTTVANLFRLEDENKILNGMVYQEGDRARPHYWERKFIGVVDPRTNAIGEMHDLRNKFLTEVEGKKDAGKNSYHQSPTRKMRRAAEAEDWDAFLEAKSAYEAGGGSARSFFDSIRRIDPISERLSDEKENRFESEFLTPQQKTKLKTARDFARELECRLALWWGLSGESSSKEKDAYLSRIVNRAADPVTREEFKAGKREPSNTTVEDRERLKEMKVTKAEAIKALNDYWADQYAKDHPRERVKPGFFVRTPAYKARLREVLKLYAEE